MKIPLSIGGSFLLALSLANATPLPNAGFEDAEAGWALDSMSKVVPEAAREGRMGLRVTDDSPTGGSSAISSRLPVQPGQEIILSFAAKTDSTFSGVYLWFYDASGRVIKDPSQRAGQGSPVVGVNKANGEWNEYVLSAKAPEGAESVAIWVHSFSSATGTADFDDFEFEGIGEGVVAIAAPTPPPTPAPVILPERAKPPIVILKFDDFRPIEGKVNGLELKLADFLKARGIRSGIGMHCDKIAEAPPEFAEWVKARHAEGHIEFWFHGWDGGVWDGNGKKNNEFFGRTYEEQWDRFSRAQAVAKEKFGFPFQTFGPPGGGQTPSFDENTIKVMAADPAMKAFLYPQPMDAPGKALDAGGKVAVLDRVWAVNTEAAVGRPDFQKFLEGYAKNPEREYFVLQGHPMHWGDAARWNEFVKIIDFLQKQNAVFMTPTEFAASNKTAAADTGS
jgi:hypothetical protein